MVLLIFVALGADLIGKPLGNGGGIGMLEGGGGMLDAKITDAGGAGIEDDFGGMDGGGGGGARGTEDIPFASGGCRDS